MKIALVNPDAFTVWQFRRGLIEALMKQGVSVHVVNADDAYADRVKALGVTYHPVQFSRFLDIKGDAIYLASLWKIFRKESFDIVHNFTVKPNVYGAIAAKLAGVPRIIDTVEGLGFVFSCFKGLRGRLFQRLLVALYRLAFGLSDRVWFVNGDDMDFMVSSGIVRRQKAVLIRSIGINLTQYSMASVDSYRLENLKRELGVAPGVVLVSMIVSRLVWSKGVAEFVEAARMLLPHFPRARFILVGPVDEGSPDYVPMSFVEKELPPNVCWSDFRDDVRELLALSEVVVLPSYYGEGVPRILLEAMAMGKPIVATDNVGCREVVENGKNGFLVPVRDSSALAAAIETLITDDECRKQFGLYSRAKAEAEFDEAVVVKRVLGELYGLHA
jgi:N,N'-diacetylbacillosaminyl-diphospho-undecaprenol alpha-1,3-N-acetylgalactosaminyltransferase